MSLSRFEGMRILADCRETFAVGGAGELSIFDTNRLVRPISFIMLSEPSPKTWREPVVYRRAFPHPCLALAAVCDASGGKVSSVVSMFSGHEVLFYM